jgi:hypothetical protein
MYKPIFLPEREQKYNNKYSGAVVAAVLWEGWSVTLLFDETICTTLKKVKLSL